MFEVRWVTDGVRHKKSCVDIEAARFACTLLEGARVEQVEVWQLVERRQGNHVERERMVGLRVVE